jgi:hypothetical protein
MIDLFPLFLILWDSDTVTYKVWIFSQLCFKGLPNFLFTYIMQNHVNPCSIPSLEITILDYHRLSPRRIVGRLADFHPGRIQR